MNEKAYSQYLLTQFTTQSAPCLTKFSIKTTADKQRIRNSKNNFLSSNRRLLHIVWKIIFRQIEQAKPPITIM